MRERVELSVVLGKLCCRCPWMAVVCMVWSAGPAHDAVAACNFLHALLMPVCSPEDTLLLD